MNRTKKEIEKFSWGILKPEELPSVRRQQDLGLSSSVRYFNDRSVPGLGGLWFPMPLVWSILAVAIKERLGKKSALPIANAIEALVMKFAINTDTKDGKERMRGTQKLQYVTDLSFKNLTRPGVYVVQPIRMAMVQPLVELGFVTGSRYGAFQLTDLSRKMLEIDPMKQWLDSLETWAKGGEVRGKIETTVKALSPLNEVNKVIRKEIKSRIENGDGGNDDDATRRKSLIVLGKLTSKQLEQPEPVKGVSKEHWQDLRAGVAFINLRDSALSVLANIEKEFQKRREHNKTISLSLDEAVTCSKKQIKELKKIAKNGAKLIEDSGEKLSIDFVKLCNVLKEDELIAMLAKRDSTVIKWLENEKKLVPGQAFGNIEINSETLSHPNDKDEFPPQLFRLWNLHCLMQELDAT